MLDFSHLNPIINTFKLEEIQEHSLDLRDPGFHPIAFTFSENSDYWRESLLAKHCWVISTNFLFSKVCARQCFASTPQSNFPARNLKR